MFIFSNNITTRNDHIYTKYLPLFSARTAATRASGLTLNYLDLHKVSYRRPRTELFNPCLNPNDFCTFKAHSVYGQLGLRTRESKAKDGTHRLSLSMHFPLYHNRYESWLVSSIIGSWFSHMLVRFWGDILFLGFLVQWHKRICFKM